MQLWQRQQSIWCTSTERRIDVRKKSFRKNQPLPIMQLFLWPRAEHGRLTFQWIAWQQRETDIHSSFSVVYPSASLKRKIIGCLIFLKAQTTIFWIRFPFIGYDLVGNTSHDINVLVQKLFYPCILLMDCINGTVTNGSVGVRLHTIEFRNRKLISHNTSFITNDHANDYSFATYHIFILFECS